jgi:hypothetical protein
MVRLARLVTAGGAAICPPCRRGPGDLPALARAACCNTRENQVVGVTARRGTAIAQSSAREGNVMHNQLRTIPRSLALAALSLLATASFTLAPLAENGGAPARPEDDSSPVRLESSIQSGCELQPDCPTR